jgi:hypothetical protein
VGATAIATIIAMVAAKILNAYWGRTDVTDAARYRVYQEMQAANDRAGQWKNLAWSDPTRYATLGVQPGSQGIRLDGPHDPTPGSPGGGGVLDRQPPP